MALAETEMDSASWPIFAFPIITFAIISRMQYSLWGVRTESRQTMTRTKERVFVFIAETTIERDSTPMKAAPPVEQPATKPPAPPSDFPRPGIVKAVPRAPQTSKVAG